MSGIVTGGWHEAVAQGRRRLVAATGLSLAWALLVGRPAVAVAGTGGGPLIEVWKDASCGCCAEWMQQMERAGFQVRAHDSGNAAMRARLRIDPRYGSCHTALVGGYAIEGHVPAREIRRLLRERPQAIGLAVPGMPIGSPGMDSGGYAGRKDPYDVLLLTADGRASVFQSYR
ncbi:MAG: DUF411 domain-containing protein [Pseudomonadota bacterium]|jgi:hypothetical protein|nr:DUF411 domain-containing protein [Rubrivivax sp.]MCA3258422.1 DUF411 domain-containing protein [Rubrivivax sp.]